MKKNQILAFDFGASSGRAMLGTLENGNYYFDGAGDEPWFQMQFLFNSATVEWDEFRKPAWYEEKPFKK